MEDTDRKFINSLFTEKYYKIYNLHVLYVLNLVFFILSKLNIINYLKSDYMSYEDLIRNFNFHFQAKYSIIWMLNFLKWAGYLEKKEQGGKIYFKIQKDIPHSSQDKIASQILELDNNWYVSIELMRSIILEYELFLTGKKSGLEILFARDKIKLWDDYFNNTFSGYAIFNIFGAYGVSKWFSKASGERILELGGGTAGATIKLLEVLQDKNLMDKIKEYIFSDISLIFLRTGNRNIIEKFKNPPVYSLKKMDFNISFEQQGVYENSLDVVYGVNALHVAKDLSFSLKEIYGSLKDRGILIISELVRPKEEDVLCQEFIFNLLEDYYNVKLDLYLRPSHGFLTPECWKRNFERIGFKNIELITNEQYGLQNPSLNIAHPVFALVIKGQKG